MKKSKENAILVLKQKLYRIFIRTALEGGTEFVVFVEIIKEKIGMILGSLILIDYTENAKEVPPKEILNLN
jgi:hypothetical protein